MRWSVGLRLSLTKNRIQNKYWVQGSNPPPQALPQQPGAHRALCTPTLGIGTSASSTTMTDAQECRLGPLQQLSSYEIERDWNLKRLCILNPFFSFPLQKQQNIILKTTLQRTASWAI
jgi:hypothetical protein